MSDDEEARRTGRGGGILVAVVVCGSAVGVMGWYFNTNRTGPTIDGSGFDLSTAPQSRRAAPVAGTAPAPEDPNKGLMVMGEPGVQFGDSAPSGKAAGSPPAKSLDKKAQSHADFKEQAIKHEADVRNFSIKMSHKFPILKQYANDWMKHPDLKKLHDDYFKTHDPIAFIVGMTKAPSLGPLVKQYAGNPAIMAYVTGAIKEAPGDLSAAAMDVISNDKMVNGVLGNIAGGLGLPPSVTSILSGGSDPAKADTSKIAADVMKSAAAQGQQAPPPVSTGQ